MEWGRWRVKDRWKRGKQWGGGFIGPVKEEAYGGER